MCEHRVIAVFVGAPAYIDGSTLPLEDRWLGRSRFAWSIPAKVLPVSCTTSSDTNTGSGLLRRMRLKFRQGLPRAASQAVRAHTALRPARARSLDR